MMGPEQKLPPKYIPTDADYEKAEMDLLCDGLKRTHTERFLMMTTLMKMNIMMRKAKIIRKAYIQK